MFQTSLASLGFTLIVKFSLYIASKYFRWNYIDNLQFQWSQQYPLNSYVVNDCTISYQRCFFLVTLKRLTFGLQSGPFLLTTTNVVTMLTMIMTWFCSTNENTMLADVKETAFCVLWSQIRSLVWMIPWQSFRHPLLFLSCYDDIEIKTDVSIMLLYHI